MLLSSDLVVVVELPDRIRRLDVRGPDHPHEVGKAPVEGDDTVMGSNSNNFAVSSMAKRGVNKHLPVSNTGEIKEDGTLRQLLHKFEHDDELFGMNDEYVDPIEGMVFKYGAQGLSYYTDKSLVEICEESQQQQSLE
jgi:hypothetical protein